MMIRIRRGWGRATWVGLVVLLISFGFPLRAQVKMTLTGAGSNGPLGGVYVGPYQGTISGVSSAIICDDFSDNSYLNESWTATPHSLSDLSGSNYASDGLKDYEEAAWLSTQLLLPSVPCPPGLISCKGVNAAGDIQFAIWGIFDPSAVKSLGQKDQNYVKEWIAEAAGKTYTLDEFSDFTIYTPDLSITPTCSGGPCPTAPPQEFLAVSTPEPPELTTLAVDLSAVGLLVLLFRRRARRS